MALDRTWYNALVDDDGSNTVGTVWGKDDINNLLNSIDALHNAHCLQRLSVTVNAASATWATVPFDITEADPLGLSLGGGIVRVPAAGVYGVSAVAIWAPSAAGTARYATLAINGAVYPSGPIPVAPIATLMPLRVIEVVSVAANAQLSLSVWQDSGGPLGLQADSRLHVWRVA